MHDFVFFKGECLSAGGASITAPTAAALYGKGIFTTIAVYDRTPFLWEKHWRRLVANAGAIAIDLNGITESAVYDALDRTIKLNGLKRGKARVTLFDESPSAHWPNAINEKTSLLIQTGDTRHLDERAITVSSHPIDSRSPLVNVKSCNYLEKILILDEANERGAQEAIRINERGEVTSAVMANIFWLEGGKLFTPPLSTGCLDGTTREYVLENLDHEEVVCGTDQLREVDAIILTSGGLGIVQASKFDDRRFAPNHHPIFSLIPGSNV
ncbi:MAG: aminotransferase class IV [Pyrinomonadaceae bacterium]